MFKSGKTRVRIDFQRRYEAYARNHGMTRTQMLTHDRESFPDAALKPFLLWCSSRQIEWRSQRRDSGPQALSDFERWIETLEPAMDALTCECHKKLRGTPSR